MSSNLTTVIKEVLDDASCTLVKNKETKNSEWTKSIMNALSKAGKDSGYSAYASSCKNADGGEWLYDLTWLKYSGENLVDVGLVLECEWNMPMVEIRNDFQKLMLARSEIRCLIFQANNEGDVEKIIEELITQVQRFSRGSDNDFYLFCGYDNSENCFYYEEY